MAGRRLDGTVSGPRGDAKIAAVPARCEKHQRGEQEQQCDPGAFPGHSEVAFLPSCLQSARFNLHIVQAARRRKQQAVLATPAPGSVETFLDLPVDPYGWVRESPKLRIAETV